MTQASTEEEQGPAAGRYGFARLLSESWTLYRARPLRLIGLFCVIHLLAALVPFAILFDVPDDAALPVVFLVRVIIPVMAGSLGVASVSPMLARVDRRQQDPDGPPSRGLRTETIALSLIASLLGAVIVIFLGAFGFLILHLCYGPPIAMQLLAVEGMSLPEVASRTRLMLRGNWRIVLYLFSISVVIGLVGFVLIGGAFSLVRNETEAIAAGAVALAQGLTLGALTAFLAAAQVAAYLQLSDPLPAGPPASSAAEPIL